MPQSVNEPPPLPDLTGRRISVTHSGDGAQRLIRTFRRLNATVGHVPLIEFELLRETGRLMELQDVTWLVLTSPQGVRALRRAIHPQAVPGGVRWAAVGESTARAMQEAGLPVHFTPGRATGRALGQELPLGAAGTVLHVTSDQAKHDLAEALRARGGQYERLVLYRTVPRQLAPAETAQLLTSHAVTLASSSAAQHLAQLGGQRVPVAVMGWQTADTARDLGFQTVMTARQPTLESLAASIIAFLAPS